MAKLTDNAITKLHDTIEAHAGAYETLSLSVIDKSHIVGTIVVNNSIFNVQAKVVGGPADGGPGGAQRPAQVFTILCAIDGGNGTSTGSGWQYMVPHPFGGLEYIVTVLNANTNQEQHFDITKHLDYAILNVAQQATQCYDVTFIGFVA